jgi:prepilin-type processing-associated H-X9-DG protein
LFNKYEGLFTNRSQNSLDRITDGASNTLLFGEILGGEVRGVKQYSACWMGVGALPTVAGMQTVNPRWFQFSSLHPGSVQFCFADGSARSLKPGSSHQSFPFRGPFTDDWYVFQQLAGFHDSDIRETSSLLP